MERLHALLEEFYAELNRHTGCSGDCKSLADDTLREIGAVGTLVTVSGQGKMDELGSAMGTADLRLLIAAWLVFHGAGKLAAIEQHPLVAASWLGELGLERAFTEALAEASEGVEESGHEEGIALLLRPLLRWQNFFAGWDRNAAQARFTLLFADPGVREFLKCHTYEESEWFNTERFEMLLKWLFTVEALGLAADKEPEQLINEIATLRKALHHLQAVAVDAGFRLDRFLGMLQTESLGTQNKNSSQ
jgi:hypothetical protein